MPQELKDFGRLAGGTVAFCDIDKTNRKRGCVGGKPTLALVDSRDYSFLEYFTQEDADRAVKDLDGRELLGNIVTLSGYVCIGYYTGELASHAFASRAKRPCAQITSLGSRGLVPQSLRVMQTRSLAVSHAHDRLSSLADLSTETTRRGICMHRQKSLISIGTTDHATMATILVTAVSTSTRRTEMLARTGVDVLLGPPTLTTPTRTTSITCRMSVGPRWIKSPWAGSRCSPTTRRRCALSNNFLSDGKAASSPIKSITLQLRSIPAIPRLSNCHMYRFSLHRSFILCINWDIQGM